jgi:uncharacterized protein YcgI (DUF1989 family)
MSTFPDAPTPLAAKNHRLAAEFLAPASHGVAFRLTVGDLLQIVDISGQQVGDFVSFLDGDWNEYFSPAHTVTQNWSIALRPGSVLASNRRNDFLRLLEDTVGYHDIVVPCCDAEAYLKRYNLADHRSCKSNLEEAFAALGHDVTIRGENAWNIFMKTAIGPDGKMTYLAPTHGPGSYLVAEALVDQVCGLSACPQDQTPTNGFNCTSMLARVWSPS